MDQARTRARNPAHNAVPLAGNVTGSFVTTQEAVRHMKDGGRVVHTGSFVASPQAAFVTGADVVADGGFTS